MDLNQNKPGKLHPDSVDYQFFLQEELENLTTLPQAFICANDFVAIDLLHVLNRMKISIPDEVKILEFDNAIMNFIGNVLDCFFLNVLCLVCCIPMVTIGASTTALYYCSIKLAKDETVSVFHSFRVNFIPATKITLIFLAVGIILELDGFIFFHFPIRGTLWCIGMGFLAMFCVCYAIIHYPSLYLCPAFTA